LFREHGKRKKKGGVINGGGNKEAIRDPESR